MIAAITGVFRWLQFFIKIMEAHFSASLPSLLSPSDQVIRVDLPYKRKDDSPVRTSTKMNKSTFIKEQLTYRPCLPQAGFLARTKGKEDG